MKIHELQRLCRHVSTKTSDSIFVDITVRSYCTGTDDYSVTISRIDPVVKNVRKEEFSSIGLAVNHLQSIIDNDTNGDEINE